MARGIPNPNIPGFGADGQGFWSALTVLVASWLFARFIIYTFGLDRWLTELSNELRQLLGLPAREDAV